MRRHFDSERKDAAGDGRVSRRIIFSSPMRRGAMFGIENVRIKRREQREAGEKESATFAWRAPSKRIFARRKIQDENRLPKSQKMNQKKHSTRPKHVPSSAEKLGKAYFDAVAVTKARVSRLKTLKPPLLLLLQNKTDSAERTESTSEKNIERESAGACETALVLRNEGNEETSKSEDRGLLETDAAIVADADLGAPNTLVAQHDKVEQKRYHESQSRSSEELHQAQEAFEKRIRETLDENRTILRETAILRRSFVDSIRLVKTFKDRSEQLARENSELRLQIQALRLQKEAPRTSSVPNDKDEGSSDGENDDDDAVSSSSEEEEEETDDETDVESRPNEAEYGQERDPLSRIRRIQQSTWTSTTTPPVACNEDLAAHKERLRSLPLTTDHPPPPPPLHSSRSDADVQSIDTCAQGDITRNVARCERYHRHAAALDDEVTSGDLRDDEVARWKRNRSAEPASLMLAASARDPRWGGLVGTSVLDLVSAIEDEIGV